MRFRWDRAKRWLLDLYAEIDRTRALGLAAETAFWVFLSLLPLFAVAGYVAARLSLENWQALLPLLNTLPPAAQELLNQELQKVARWDGGAVGIVGTATFIWLASSGVHAIFDALEVETGSTRPWLRQRILSVAVCLGLSLCVAILAALGPGIAALVAFADADGEWLGLTGAFGGVVRFVIAFAILLAQIYGLYWVGIPSAARRNMPLFPGAFTTTVLQMLLSFAYGMYVSLSGDGAAYSAGLAIVGLTLTALYLSVTALLIGAAINRKLGSSRNKLGNEPELYRDNSAASLGA